MAHPKQGWILLTTALAWMASSRLIEQPALAGPQRPIVDLPIAALPLTTPTASKSTISPSVESLDAGSLTTSADSALPGSASVSQSNRAFDEQPPMIPLPPSMWAGLVTLGGVAWHTVRQTARRKS